MKVIGQAGPDFILSASRDEVARLIGYFAAYAAQRAGKMPEVGDEIRVGVMYEYLRQVAEANRDLQTVAAKLRAAADLIGTLPDPIHPVHVGPDEELNF